MYAGRSRAASAPSQRRLSAPRSVVAIAFLLFIDVAHVGCMSLDRLGAGPTELELQLADKGPAAPAYQADESVLVDDMELEAVPAGGSDDMYMLVPAGGAAERESVDRNTIEDGGAKRQDEPAQEAGDMLMMESNDAPVVEMLVAPPQDVLIGDDESDQVKVLAEPQVVTSEKDSSVSLNDEVEEKKEENEEAMAEEDKSENLVLVNSVEQMLPVEKESNQKALESEEVASLPTTDATSEEENNVATVEEMIADAIEEMEQNSASDSNAEEEASTSTAEETQSNNDSDQTDVKDEEEDLEKAAQDEKEEDLEKASQDEREEAIESLTAIEEDMFPEQSVEQAVLNIPLEAAVQDQQSEESEASAPNEQQTAIEKERVEEVDVQPEPAKAAEEIANVEEAQVAEINTEAEVEPKPLERLEVVEVQETNKNNEEETPTVEAEVQPEAVAQNEVQQEDEDQKAEESEIVESDKVEEPQNVEEVDEVESEEAVVTDEEQKQEVEGNQVAAEMDEVKEEENPNEEKQEVEKQEEEILEDKKGEEIKNSDEKQEEVEIAEEEHAEAHETETEELHKEENETIENKVQPESEADEKETEKEEDEKEEDEKEEQTKEESEQSDNQPPEKQELASAEEIETIQPLETLPAIETAQENELVDPVENLLPPVEQTEKIEEPAAESVEAKPEVEEQEEQEKEKEEENQQINESSHVTQEEEASTATVAQAPEPNEPTSMLTTIVQVPQQQQQQQQPILQPPQLQYGEQDAADEEEDEQGLPQQSWQQQLVAQQQQQAALLQSQQQQFLSALQQAQREQQQQQQQQQQEMATPIKIESVASPAIESATQQSLNVIDSVLNYVNASFMQQNNKQQPLPLQDNDEQAFNSKLRRYDGAQVWRIVVQSDRDRKLADELQTKYGGQLWKEVKQEVDYLLKPQVLADAAMHIRSANLSRIVLIDNLQNAIERENPPADEIALLQNRKGHRLTWQAYHRLADIHGFFDYLAKTYPDICSVETIGYSIEKRPLKILKISNGNAGNPGFWIDGGMHAREWISPASVTYIANQLVEGWDDLPAYMRNINWYLHPVANPDGYEYSHTTDRLWRKNMRSHGRQCPGVDLNRNFGYKWGGKGTSANPCSQTYRGSKAFSEPESFYISKFISNFPRDTFHAYLSFHSYGQYILYPWGYDYQLTADMSDLDRVARQAGTIITKKSGVKYTVGSSASTLYPAAGGSDDWAKGFAGIKYSYTVEMGDTGRYGFVLPASYIESNAKDGYTFVETVAHAVTQGKDSRKRAF